MDPERWKEVDALLQSALRLPADQREEFVRKACCGDAALEQEVQSLLISDQEAGSFLGRPAIEVAARAAAQTRNSELNHLSPPLEGQIISHYRIVSKLGGGGMGEVDGYKLDVCRWQSATQDAAKKIVKVMNLFSLLCDSCCVHLNSSSRNRCGLVVRGSFCCERADLTKKCWKNRWQRCGQHTQSGP